MRDRSHTVGLGLPVEVLRRTADLLDPYVRLVVGMAGLLATAYLGGRGIIWIWTLAPFSIYLAWDFFRHGGVWRAFRAFRRGQLEAVRQELGRVWWPNILSPVTRSYYHWLRGVIDAADGRYAAARVHLLVAAAGKLKTEKDRALVQCLLAETAFQDGQYSEAEAHAQMAGALSKNAQINRLMDDLSQRIAGNRT